MDRLFMDLDLGVVFSTGSRLGTMFLQPVVAGCLDADCCGKVNHWAGVMDLGVA